MFRWLLLLGLLAPAAQADDFIDWLSDPSPSHGTLKSPTHRESFVTVSTEIGKGGRYGVGLSTAIGLDSEWQFLASGNYSRLDATTGILEGRLGANFQKSRQFELNLSGSGSVGPGTNRAFGTLIEAQWWLSALWNGKRATVLRTTGGYTHYSLPIGLLATRQVPVSSFQGTWGLMQEMFAGFFVELSYSCYSYDVSADLIRRGLTNSRVLPSSSYGAVTQFPSHEWLLTAKWNASERLSFGSGAFSTRTFATGTTTWGVSPYAEVALSPSIITTVRGTLSWPGDGTTSYLMAALIDFYW